MARLIERRLAQVDWGDFDHPHAPPGPPRDPARVPRPPVRRPDEARTSGHPRLLDCWTTSSTSSRSWPASAHRWRPRSTSPRCGRSRSAWSSASLQSISQWLKPSQRSTRRGHRRRSRCAAEMWAFLQRRERYRARTTRSPGRCSATRSTGSRSASQAEQEQEASQVHQAYSVAGAESLEATRPHAGGDPSLRPGADRRRRRIASRSASASCSRPSTRRSPASRRPAPRRPCRGPAARGPALRSTCSNAANHLRIMYSCVAQDQERDRHLVGDRGPQRGDPVLRRPLPHHAHHRPIGLGQLHSHGGRRSRSRARRYRSGSSCPARTAEPVAERRRARGRPRPRRSRRQATRRRARPSPASRSSGPACAGRRRLGTRIGGVAVGFADQLDQLLERQRHVADERVAHRRPRRLVRVARQRDQRSTLPEAAGQGCTGSTGTPRCRPRGPRRGPQRLRERADRRRQDRRRSSDGARGTRSGSLAVPGEAQTGSRCFSASATAAFQPPLASTSGPATSTGLRADSSRLASCASSAGSGTARPPTTRRRARAAARSSSASASQSSIGIDTNAGPRGASVAWWMARPIAPGTSCARGGSWLHFTYGCGPTVASRLVSSASWVICGADLLAGGDHQRRLVRPRGADRRQPRCPRPAPCAGSRGSAVRSPAHTRPPSRPRPAPGGRART